MQGERINTRTGVTEKMSIGIQLTQKIYYDKSVTSSCDSCENGINYSVYQKLEQRIQFFFIIPLFIYILIQTSHIHQTKQL